MKTKIMAAAGLVLALAGCAGQRIEDYRPVQPTFDMREYLNGELEAWGMVFDYAGRQNTRFHVKMTGTWNGNKGTLDEHFVYDDGRTDRRTWQIEFSDDNNFTATAHDVVGPAIGQQMGNAVRMAYTLRLPRGDSSIDLSMDDWMYRIDDKHVLNKTSMRKFGVKVGELVVVFNKK
jgi:hypothetical protein